MYCCYRSYGVMGIDAYQVQVEVDLARAFPGFEIVGLPDAAVKESRDRVRAAMSTCGYPFPVGKIVLNLAPAAVKKTGPMYDVPILLAMMSAKGYLPEPAVKQAFLGELALDGSLRPVRGVLSMVLQARDVVDEFIAFGQHDISVECKDTTEFRCVKNINLLIITFF